MCKQEQLLDTSHPGSEGSMQGRARERGEWGKGVSGDSGGLRIRKGTRICSLFNPDGGTQSEAPSFHCRTVSVLAKPALSLRDTLSNGHYLMQENHPSSHGAQQDSSLGAAGLEPASASPLLLREEGEPGGVELLPDALELLQEEPHVLLVLHDEHVLPVVLNGLRGPVEGASDQHLPVHDGELVVHVAQVLVVPDLDPCKVRDVTATRPPTAAGQAGALVAPTLEPLAPSPAPPLAVHCLSSGSFSSVAVFTGLTAAFVQCGGHRQVWVVTAAEPGGGLAGSRDRRVSSSGNTSSPDWGRLPTPSSVYDTHHPPVAGFKTSQRRLKQNPLDLGFVCP